MVEHGRARKAEEAKRRGRSHEEERESMATKGGRARENNVPGAGVACVILAEQSAASASGRPFCSVKMVDCPPNYTSTYRSDAVGTAKLTELSYCRCLSAGDLRLSELHYRARRYHRLAVAGLV